MTIYTDKFKDRARFEVSTVEEALEEVELPECKQEGCNADAAMSGLCTTHYLASKVVEFREKYTPVPESGCWLWEGAANDGGYGVILFGKKKVLAHRFSFALHNNRSITESMLICHSCDVPACVNPHHLHEGTPRDNAVDAMRKNRLVKKLTPEKVKLVRKLWDQGIWTQKDIASIVALSQGAVSGIIRNKRWDCGVSGSPH